MKKYLWIATIMLTVAVFACDRPLSRSAQWAQDEANEPDEKLFPVINQETVIIAVHDLLSASELTFGLIEYTSDSTLIDVLMCAPVNDSIVVLYNSQLGFTGILRVNDPLKYCINYVADNIAARKPQCVSFNELAIYVTPVKGGYMVHIEDDSSGEVLQDGMFYKYISEVRDGAKKAIRNYLPIGYQSMY